MWHLWKKPFDIKYLRPVHAVQDPGIQQEPLTINGERHYLWCAVDQDGNVLDILVQSRRNKKAAKRFFRKLLKGLHYVPRVIITDTLKSYGAAKREILPGVDQFDNVLQGNHGSLRECHRLPQRPMANGAYMHARLIDTTVS